MESKRNFSGNQSKLHDDYYNQKFDLDQYEPKDLGVELFHTIKVMISYFITNRKNINKRINKQPLIQKFSTSTGRG